MLQRVNINDEYIEKLVVVGLEIEYSHNWHCYYVTYIYYILFFFIYEK